MLADKSRESRVGLIEEAMQEELGETPKKKAKPQPKKQAKDDDPVLYYMKDGEFRQTTLFTEDMDSFLEWACFIFPPAATNKSYLNDLRTSARTRKELYVSAYHNAQSVYMLLFRSLKEGPLGPIIYKGEGQ